MKTNILSLVMLFSSMIILGQKDNSQEAEAHQKTLNIQYTKIIGKKLF